MKSKSKSKVKVEGEERKAKPKMTAEQKACLAAFKSLDADVERAKEITSCAEYVLRELCKSCKNVKACKKLKSMPMINCRMSAIMGVSIGMIQEERKATLEATWERLHGQMAALKAKQEGGAK